METYKYWGILKVNTIKQLDMKEKNKSTSEIRKSFSKPRSVAEISSKEITPG